MIRPVAQAVLYVSPSAAAWRGTSRWASLVAHLSNALDLRLREIHCQS